VLAVSPNLGISKGASLLPWLKGPHKWSLARIPPPCRKHRWPRSYGRAGANGAIRGIGGRGHAESRLWRDSEVVSMRVTSRRLR